MIDFQPFAVDIDPSLPGADLREAARLQRHPSLGEHLVWLLQCGREEPSPSEICGNSLSRRQCQVYLLQRLDDVETGYSALSLSAIAAHAGTTTAAIYRRWSGKAQLVHEAVLPAESIPTPGGSGDVRQDIRALVETIRTMFDAPEVRMALPGLIADTVANPEVHSMMIARLAGNLTAFESRFRQERRGDDELPMIAELVAGTAIFRILIRRDSALDETWVNEMTEMITERWPSAETP